MSKPITRLGLDYLGRNGLDTQTTPTTLTPDWLTTASNITYTDGGKITFRKGLYQRTQSAGSKIGALGEYVKDGTLFAAVNDDIYKVNLNNPTAGFDAEFTPLAGGGSDWQFINFNNSLFGVQEGSPIVRWNGTTWNTLTVYHNTTNEIGIEGFDKPTTISTFNPSCGLGDFGRLWVAGVVEEKDVIFYSKLKNESDFNDADAGLLDLKSVWGTDEIVNLANFGGKLVVFGKRNIAIYNNPHSPLEMVLEEVIKGIGCVCRDSVQSIGDDLFFLSDTGVRSLYRTAEKDKLPLQEKSLTIKDDLIGKIKQNKNVKTVYMQDEGLYLLSFVDLNITYVFDLAFITEKDTPRVTTWDFDVSNKPSSLLYTEQHGLLIGQAIGTVATYEGYYDTTFSYNSTTEVISHTNVSYKASFSTPWLSLGGEGGMAVILKRLQFVVDGGENTTISLKLFRDFENVAGFIQNIVVNPPQLGTKYYWGATNSLWDAAKYAPLYGFKEKSLPLKGTAKYLQMEMVAMSKGNKTSLQGVSLLFLQGKTR